MMHTNKGENKKKYLKQSPIHCYNNYQSIHVNNGRAFSAT